MLWHELTVEGDEEVLTVLALLLPRAEHPMPPRRAMAYRVQRVPSGFEIFEEDDLVSIESTAREAGELVHVRAHRRAFELASLAGWVRLHAATVDLDGTRVLLVGQSGAGKSTLALRLLLDGAQFQGDESVLVRAGTSLAVPRPLVVKAGFEQFVPELADDLTDLPRPDGVGIFDPARVRPPWRLRAAPIDHLVLLDGRPGPPSCRPAGGAELLEILARDTFLFTETKSALIATLAPIVRESRCHRLARGDPAAMVLALRAAVG